MIRVHHLEKSRSHRILWLLETLGLDYGIEVYQRDPKTQLAPASLKKIHQGQLLIISSTAMVMPKISSLKKTVMSG